MSCRGLFGFAPALITPLMASVRAAGSRTWSTALNLDLAVVVVCVPLALALGAATLRRRTP